MQDFTIEEFLPLFNEIRNRFPTLGARGMISHLRQHYTVKLPEYVSALLNPTDTKRCKPAESLCSTL